MIVTPKRLEQRAEFYHQIGTLTEAGLSLVQSLESLNRTKRSRVLGQPIVQLLDQLEGGATFSEAAAGIKGWLPAFDLALIDSGERSGRLDVCLRLLAEFYRQRAQAVSEVIRQLMYPLLIVHAAILLGPFPQLFLTGDIVSYGKTIGSILVPVYLVIFVLVYLAQGKHGYRMRSLLETVFGLVPLLGAARKALALSRFCLALEALLAAGTNVGKAWSLSADASGSPKLQRVVGPFISQIEGGRTPGELLDGAGFFPDVFVSLFTSGEVSGQIDENLKRLRIYYQDEGFGKMKQFSVWFPRMIYFGIMGYIVYTILSFYSGYYDSVFDATEF
jgi:type IV pilus assembly protein PilC